MNFDTESMNKVYESTNPRQLYITTIQGETKQNKTNVL